MSCTRTLLKFQMTHIHSRQSGVFVYSTCAPIVIGTRIRLQVFKEEEIVQHMWEVDLVKGLSHPSIVKNEGMARDNTLSAFRLLYTTACCCTFLSSGTS